MPSWSFRKNLRKAFYGGLPARRKKHTLRVSRGFRARNDLLKSVESGLSARYAVQGCEKRLPLSPTNTQIDEVVTGRCDWVLVCGDRACATEYRVWGNSCF